jgi:ATP-dependent Clp protease ATP-binding subunit ClpB
VIILTSNLGSDIIAAQVEGEDIETVREPVMDVVRAAFRPEFLNRIDEITLFHHLSRSHMDGIVEIQLSHLDALLADRKISLRLDAAAAAWLADKGYDPVYGARPLKRAIQRHLQNPLANMILDSAISEGDTVIVTAGPSGLEINGQAVVAA